MGHANSNLRNADWVREEVWNVWRNEYYPSQLREDTEEMDYGLYHSNPITDEKGGVYDLCATIESVQDFVNQSDLITLSLEDGNQIVVTQDYLEKSLLATSAFRREKGLIPIEGEEEAIIGFGTLYDLLLEQSDFLGVANGKSFDTVLADVTDIKYAHKNKLPDDAIFFEDLLNILEESEKQKQSSDFDALALSVRKTITEKVREVLVPDY